MSDELTPREKELLDRLPRERMPEGLEGRVVEAMREKGYLAKQRRSIEITNTRVAGLLAASVALVIGAYSIGLHRGGDGVVSVIPLERDARVGSPAADFEESKPVVSDDVAEAGTESPAGESRDEDNAATGRSQASVPAEAGGKGAAGERVSSKTETPAAPAPGTASDAVEEKAGDSPQAEQFSDRTAETGGREKRQPVVVEEEAAPQARSLAEPPASTPPSPTAARKAPTEGSLEKTLQLPQEIREDLADGRLTLLLNGTPVTVRADSARVVEEGQGRILLVYTPDGIVRLRLAD